MNQKIYAILWRTTLSVGIGWDRSQGRYHCRVGLVWNSNEILGKNLLFN